MSHMFNFKGISKSRQEIIQEHTKKRDFSTLPPPSTHFNHLKLNSTSLSNLDLFTPSANSVLYARTITHANINNETSTILEDNLGDVCQLILYGKVHLPIFSMIAILEPVLTLRDKLGTIIIDNKKHISFFNNEQEFRTAGWVQKSPPGFSCEYFRAQGANLEEKKLFKEALKKYLIGLDYDPRNIEVMEGLVKCYTASGDLENALVFSEKALELSPKSSKLVKLRAKCLVESGRISEAKSLVNKTRINDIDLDAIIEEKGTRKIAKCNRTRLSRLKELVLVEWPKLVSIEKIKKKLNDEGVHADRVSIRGKTAILIYDSVEKREEARSKLLGLEDSEFMLANEPSLNDNF